MKSTELQSSQIWPYGLSLEPYVIAKLILPVMLIAFQRTLSRVGISTQRDILQEMRVIQAPPHRNSTSSRYGSSRVDLYYGAPFLLFLGCFGFPTLAARDVEDVPGYVEGIGNFAGRVLRRPSF